jgi:hypothetical protein
MWKKMNLSPTRAIYLLRRFRPIFLNVFARLYLFDPFGHDLLPNFFPEQTPSVPLLLIDRFAFAIHFRLGGILIRLHVSDELSNSLSTSTRVSRGPGLEVLIEIHLTPIKKTLEGAPTTPVQGPRRR